MKKILPPLILLLSLAAMTFAQATATPSPTPDSAKKKGEILDFLKSVELDVANLRLPENRLSFTSEIAAIQWQYDETLARKSYTNVAADLRQLMTQYDSEIAMKRAADADDVTTFGLFGSGDKSEQKMQMALGVRAEIAKAIAQNDGELALNFLTETAGVVTDSKMREKIESMDQGLTLYIAKTVATKDPKKALAIAIETLKTGSVTQSHLQLLSVLAKKDADLAARLASAIKSNLTGVNSKTETYMLSSIIKTAGELYEAAQNDPSQKSPFTQSDIRDIANILADRIEKEEAYVYQIDEVEKWSPTRAAALRTKFKKTSDGDVPLISSVKTVRVNGNVPWNGSNSNSGMDPKADAQWKRRAEERSVLDGLAKMQQGSLPKEEREKILANARKIISGMRDPADKVAGLSMLATQVVKADKDLAMELMRETDRLAPVNPKNYQDFLVCWMVASGYAAVDPEQAFPRMENLISRANETINAGVKIAEFIDVTDQIVVDNELQVGAFGGSVLRDLTVQTKIADNTLRQLADADLQRTKQLTDRFDRPEIRVLAKMMIIRAMLDPTKGEADGMDLSIDN